GVGGRRRNPEDGADRRGGGAGKAEVASDRPGRENLHRLTSHWVAVLSRPNGTEAGHANHDRVEPTSATIHESTEALIRPDQAGIPWPSSRSCRGGQRPIIVLPRGPILQPGCNARLWSCV